MYTEICLIILNAKDYAVKRLKDKKLYAKVISYILYKYICTINISIKLKKYNDKQYKYNTHMRARARTHMYIIIFILFIFILF